MTMKEADFLYANGPFWVCRGKSGKGFEVYEDGITHAKRIAVIGYEGNVGFDRAKAEADKRAAIAQSLQDQP
jgi:hypothetical protein